MFEILAFDLAALDDAARALDDGVQAVERQLSDLRAYLEPLRAAWSGPAAQAFDTHQQWDRAAADLAASLAQLHHVVQVAHHNYGAAVAADQRMWSL